MAGAGLVAQPNFFVWGKWRSRNVDEPFLTRKVSAPVKKTVLGESFMIALTEDGRVMSWGKDDTNGCLGLGNSKKDTKKDLPGEVLFPKDSDEVVVDIQMGKEHVVALTRGGEVHAWGNGSRGQLGSGELRNQFKPKRVASGPIRRRARSSRSPSSTTPPSRSRRPGRCTPGATTRTTSSGSKTGMSTTWPSRRA
ncbi:unnamed protein product [Prorocentrum cordatum]|uniref:Uncharacterized protein n=1 Tax=Prorocentrum cordatum TaxID=2364126 RepID=A0ABN9T547_9DINO|nr:unnamed protein product [Polarella glacialis]